MRTALRPEGARRFKKDGMKLLLLALPFVALVIAFYYVPLFGWTYAFVNYKPGFAFSRMPWNNFSSFLKLISDREIGGVMVNTLAMAFLNLLISPLQVVLALLLNEVRNRHFKRAFQTVSTLPNFIGWVIIFSLSFGMFSSEGMLNQLLKMLNITDKPVNVLGNASIVWYLQTGLNIWKYTGWGAIVYLAAIAGIDPEIYDAAKVDGAGRFKTILHITVPGILPTFLVITLLTVSNMLNVGFEQYLVFYNGMVAERITVLDLYVYRLGLIIHDYSYATAVGMMKTLVSVILLFTVNGFAKKVRGESLI